jgi:hypothetical protein
VSTVPHSKMHPWLTEHSFAKCSEYLREQGFMRTTVRMYTSMLSLRKFLN